MSSADQASRPEPPAWLREHLLPHLDLPADLPVHFVDEKAVTTADLDPKQNRFRLPNHGVLRNLRPVLAARQLQAANLRYEDDDDDAVPAGEEEHGSGWKKRKRRLGRGLPVLVVDVHAGIVGLKMSRFDGGPGTTLKGQRYLDFINHCGFAVGDVVQIWAFRPCYSPLYLVIARKPE